MSSGQRTPVTVTAAIEGVVDEAVAKRLIAHVGGQTGKINGRKGKSLLKKGIEGYNEGARNSPWLVLVDLDTGCALQLRNDWLPAPAALMCFRIAVHEVEAWLLADAETLAEYLKVRASRVPPNPERLPDPKDSVVALARQSTSKTIGREMAQSSGRRSGGRPGNLWRPGPGYNSRLAEYARDRWRPGVAARRSDSLRRAIAGLRTLVANAAAR